MRASVCCAHCLELELNRGGRVSPVVACSATADYRELLRVIRVIKRMLVTTEAEATPQLEEAQRILGFFINSLAHPSLDKPPSIDKMWSWSILTPLYEEDVLYALDAKALCKLHLLLSFLILLPSLSHVAAVDAATPPLYHLNAAAIWR